MTPLNLDQLPPAAIPLPTVAQTPNGFLSSIPQLNMEFNSFEDSFHASNQQRDPGLDLLSSIVSRDYELVEKPTKPKNRTRSNSITSLASDNDGRDGFLERNRKSAQKCRLKKKDYLKSLEQSVNDLTKKNKILNDRITFLEKLLSSK